MSFLINALESPDESARQAILKRLLTYNTEQTGVSDFAPSPSRSRTEPDR